MPSTFGLLMRTNSFVPIIALERFQITFLLFFDKDTVRSTVLVVGLFLGFVIVAYTARYTDKSSTITTTITNHFYTVAEVSVKETKTKLDTTTSHSGDDELVDIDVLIIVIL